MKNKLMVILLGGMTSFLSINISQADTAYERALGVGYNQGFQGASRAGTEIYPGVWSNGRVEKSIDREEIYPGVWAESERKNTARNMANNNSGYSIVNRSTGSNNNGSFSQRENNQDSDAELIKRSEASSRESYRQNAQPNSSSNNDFFSGRSSSNTRTPPIQGITERDREYTDVSVDSLINPDFD